MSNRNVDLWIVIVFTALALGAALLPASGIVMQGLFALPLVFVLPGYVLAAILFPRGSLGFPETLTFSIGLSLGIDILGGVVLNMTSDGLTPLSWSIFLAGMTGAGCAIAARRRHERPAPVSKPFSLGLDVRQVFFFAASLVVVVYAITLVRDESLQPSTAFTELWAKPAALLGQTAFDIGVRNSEAANMEYDLKVMSGDHLLYESTAIELAPGETWNQVLTFQTLVTGEVRVLLFKTDDPGTIYRQVVSRSAAE